MNIHNYLITTKHTPLHFVFGAIEEKDEFWYNARLQKVEYIRVLIMFIRATYTFTSTQIVCKRDDLPSFLIRIEKTMLDYIRIGKISEFVMCEGGKVPYAQRQLDSHHCEGNHQ